MSFRGRLPGHRQRTILSRFSRSPPDKKRDLPGVEASGRYEENKEVEMELRIGDAAARRGVDCQAAVASWAGTGGEPGSGQAQGVVLVDDSLGLHLTPTELHVEGVGVLHVVAACDRRAEVPYEKVRPFVAPGPGRSCPVLPVGGGR